MGMNPKVTTLISSSPRPQGKYQHLTSGGALSQDESIPTTIFSSILNVLCISIRFFFKLLSFTTHTK